MEAYNSYMKISKYFLCATGLWPKQSKSTHRLISLFLLLSLMSFLVTQVLALINNWGNMDIIINCLSLCFANILSITFVVTTSINRSKIGLILSKMKQDWLLCESTSEIEILHNNGILSSNLNIARVVFSYAAMFEFLSMPLIPIFLDVIKPLNETRPRKQIHVSDYLVDTSDGQYYATIAAHQWHVTIVLTTVILTADGLFIIFIYHACCQLEILGFKMKNLVKIDFKLSTNDEQIIQKEIIFCIEKHKSVLTFVNSIKDCFSFSYFLSLGISMISLSLTGLQLIISLDHPREVSGILLFSLTQILRLFMITLPSQRLIDQSTQLSQNIHDGLWYKMSSRTQKMLIMIIMRSAIPCTFTAGKIYTFSMENFCSVIKTSVSYLTVLASVRA